MPKSYDAPRPFDAIVIGAGQAGPFLAVRLAAAGQHVAVIERSHLGGACVNDGCIPTKTLVASARVAHQARRAADWGVATGPVSVDMRAVKARKDAVVQSSVDGLSSWLGDTKNLELIWGEARFTGPHELAVGDQTLTAPRIFINAGARASRPDWPGLADTPYLTNTEMMALDVVPEHLVIVGGSYIGLEFAQMQRRFGAEVTVLEHADRLIAREDPEVSETIADFLRAEGVTIETTVRDLGFAPLAGGGARVSAITGGRTLSLEASHLLIAVGRTPNSDTLDLPAAGIATDARGFITVDDTLQTSVEGVWALGEINGRGAFTHTSYNDFEIVAANLLDGGHRRVTDRIPVYALFTDPPLGRVGLTETEVRQSGRPALKGYRPMTRVGRAVERGETTGFMKVIVDAETQQILGAALLGIEADEAVHTLIDTMYAKAPYTVIRDAVHIHPTVSELIPTMLGEMVAL